jgi:hypothetical protein
MGMMGSGGWDYYGGPSPFAAGVDAFSKTFLNAFTQMKNLGIQEDYKKMQEKLMQEQIDKQDRENALAAKFTERMKPTYNPFYEAQNTPDGPQGPMTTYGQQALAGFMQQQGIPPTVQMGGNAPDQGPIVDMPNPALREAQAAAIAQMRQMGGVKTPAKPIGMDEMMAYLPPKEAMAAMTALSVANARENPFVDIIKGGKYTPESVKKAFATGDYGLLELTDKATEQEKLSDRGGFVRAQIAQGINDPAQIEENWNKRQIKLAEGKRQIIINNPTPAKPEKPGKYDAEVIKGIIRGLPKAYVDARDQQVSIDRIDKMQSLIASGVGGKKGQIMSAIAPYVEAAGYKDKNLSDAQLYEVLAKTIGGSMRQQMVGPGQVSNYENQLLQKVSGGGQVAAGAAAELLDFYKKAAEAHITSYNESLDAVKEYSPATAKLYKKVGSGGAPAGPTVMERRKTKDGKVLEKLSDGTIREANK